VGPRDDDFPAAPPLDGARCRPAGSDANHVRGDEMTDEERQKLLVANLYSLSRDDDRATLCYGAAEEIERLAKQVETLKAQQREVRPPFYFGEGGKP
jgi:hypothetical protein